MPSYHPFVVGVSPRWAMLYGDRVYKDGFANLGIGWTLVANYFDYDEGFNEQSDVSYADTEVVGRVESYKSFVGVSNKEVSLTFDFIATGEEVTASDAVLASQFDQAIELGFESAEAEQVTIVQREVHARARFLDALKYPVTVRGVTYAPPPVILGIGSFFYMRAVATAVDIQWKGPWLPEARIPMAATVNITFTAVGDGSNRGKEAWGYPGATRARSF